MSHSKYTKRSHSLYMEKWNRSAKKYINTCAICGYRGYSPVIKYAGFCDDRPENKVIYRELTKTLSELRLDEAGRCEACARVQGGREAGAPGPEKTL